MKIKYKNVWMFICSPYINNKNERKCMKINVSLEPWSRKRKLIVKTLPQATEIAKAEGLLKKDKKVDRGKSKEELKEEEENVIRSETYLSYLSTQLW